MENRETTSLNINVGARIGTDYMADNTVIDLSMSTHLRDGGILSSMDQHLTLKDAKQLVAELNLVIAEVELELLDN